MSDSKKKVAAISAVMHYLRQQEEAFAFQQLNAVNGVPISPEAHVSFNAWGMSGRQAQMQIRNLMQMKALYRLN
ncbi:MAG: hypothetical protein JRJ39_09630 [Deltaproteobacteria bacterium]|nr:hypothetical protein [Deltaproteobacteria bacterium]MBW2181361.1 hypothetical protein [Deltaproteobacteria bacterium]